MCVQVGFLILRGRFSVAFGHFFEALESDSQFESGGGECGNLDRRRSWEPCSASPENRGARSQDAPATQLEESSREGVLLANGFSRLDCRWASHVHEALKRPLLSVLMPTADIERWTPLSPMDSPVWVGVGKAGRANH